MTARTVVRWASVPLVALLITGFGGAATTAQAAGPVTQYTLVPTPIAPQHSLAPGTSVRVTLTAFNSAGSPVSGAAVFLALTTTNAGGTATVGTVALSKTPMSFTTDVNGKVAIAFVAGSATAGKDIITAENSTSSPSVEATDSYIYSAVAEYAFSPKPIAPDASLAAGQSVTVILTALGVTGAPVPNVRVLLAFHGPGTAVVGSAILSIKPTNLLTDANGQIHIVFTAPNTLPAHGSIAKIGAEDTGHHPSIQRNDTYTY